jgi:ribonuclease HII
MLKTFYNSNCIEAGLDEAGRGPLAGPVVAAAVVFPNSFTHHWLTDSKLLSKEQRDQAVDIIKENAITWAIAEVDNQEIDQLNILNASIKAMHLAVDKLAIKPEHLLVDGNKFVPYQNIPHTCIVKGDSKFLSIAAASILAKTYRDNLMAQFAAQYPNYGWEQNFGYPTQAHKHAIDSFGKSPLHRLSFRM